MLFGLIGALESAGKIAQTQFLGYFIQYFNASGVENPPTEKETYITATILILLSMWINISHHIFFEGLWHMGLKLRMALMGLIFRKSTSLKLQA